MQAKFTIQYGEFAVAQYLSDNIKNASVFVPTSAQEKGIDLLLYKFCSGVNLVNTIQVKMSRAYRHPNKRYQNMPWFNRFTPQDNADWFILLGLYAQFPSEPDTPSKAIRWEEIMLAFKNKEMKHFMEEVRLKSDPERADKMFGFSFNSRDEIRQTRGYAEERDMSAYLIENRIKEIENSFK